MTRRQFIQSTLSVGILSFIPTVLCGCIFKKHSNFEKSWDDFIKNPTFQNSNRFYNNISIYDFYYYNDKDKAKRVGNKIDRDLSILEKYILKDNQGSVQIAFRLFSIILTNGYLGSSLNIALGRYIHVNPTYFLEEFERHYYSVSISKLLGNYGFDFVDNFELQKIETFKRIDALNTVNDNRLQYLKKRCIKKLEENYHRCYT